MNADDLYQPNTLTHRTALYTVQKLWPFIRQVTPIYPALAQDMRAALAQTATQPPNLDPLPAADMEAARARAESSPIDLVLDEMVRQKMSLNEFLTELFSLRPHGQSRSSRHAAMVSKFLQGSTKLNPRDLVEMLYSHHDSAPAATRGDSHAARNPKDASKMARAQIKNWAIECVCGVVKDEMDALVDPKTSLLRPSKDFRWSELLQFSVRSLFSTVRSRAPSLLRVLLAAGMATRRKDALEPVLPEQPSGRGKARRNPLHVALTAVMMLGISRAPRANLFQRLAGAWLWSTRAGPAVFNIFSRIGLTVAYSTTTRFLRKLGTGQLDAVRDLIKRGALFLIMYDNINVFRRIWAPQLSQQNRMLNGTAPTVVMLENCDESAFDPGPVHAARARGARGELTVERCYDEIDWAHHRSVMAHHSLLFLASWVPALRGLTARIHHEFRTTLAKRRLPAGRRTRLFSLGTSNNNEATTRGTKAVFDDVFLTQLQLDKDEVSRLLRFVWGDQMTVERARSLLKYNVSCPHPYYSYARWAETMALFWHKGWADLARCISTHFGTPSSGDPSAVGHVNVLLNRHVKDEDRPDFYPALRLISQTLKADILDCWRHILRVDNVRDALTERAMTYEELLPLAYRLVDEFMSESAAQCAERGRPLASWQIGRPWQPPSATASAAKDVNDEDAMDIDDLLPDPPSGTGAGIPENFAGDQTLANLIRRRMDFARQYEFQFSTSDGDVGRALQIIYYWLFTFAGTGHTKYMGEVLELVCKILFEYPETTRNALLDNALGSLTGEDGSYVPLDQIQEWIIGDIKQQMDKRVDKDFDDDFIRNVIAPNVLMSSECKKVIRNIFGLAAHTTNHGEAVDDASIKKLLADLESKQANYYRATRHYGFAAASDFAAGYDVLEHGGKLKDFLQRTMAGHVYGDAVSADSGTPSDSATATATQTLDDSGSLPPPPGVPFTHQATDSDLEVSDGEDYEL